MANIVLYVVLGLMAGAFSGLFGIGGGLIIIPVLVYVFGLTVHMAQGTTLALMVPPIGLLAAFTYYKNGNVDLKIAAFICIGFFIGGFFGAKLANTLSAITLKKLFGIVMLLFSIKMIMGK